MEMSREGSSRRGGELTLALAEWQEAGTAGTREAGCTSSGGYEGRRLQFLRRLHFLRRGRGTAAGFCAGRREEHDAGRREEHGAGRREEHGAGSGIAAGRRIFPRVRSTARAR
jgi:hypothetical protein